MSAALYPDVFKKYMESREFGSIDILPTNVFFGGLQVGESTNFITTDGKEISIKLLAVSDLNDDATRTAFLNVDGHIKIINIKDKQSNKSAKVFPKADKSNPLHIGAPMPGQIINIKVRQGDAIKGGDVLLTLSAMKMETIVSASCSGVIEKLYVDIGMNVTAGDLMIQLK